MEDTSKKVAEYLLQSKAIKLEPAKPFTWASGWKSPIYCDNRITLSFPDIRKFIRDAFCDLITEKFPEAEVVAGVATGAIAQSALVAEKLNLPLIYVRSGAKGHGLGNQIEGKVESGAKVVVVEDLVSTGMSSLNAVQALRSAGCEVLGMTAIFTYGFPQAEENFASESCTLFTLSNYSTLIELAVESGYIEKNYTDILNKWRQSPQTWQGIA